MGVMECRRRGCENILCHRHSCEYGYICNDCFDELIKTGPTTNIGGFMFSNKSQNNEDESRARYNAVFVFESDF